MTRHWKVVFEYGDVRTVHAETGEEAFDTATYLYPDRGKPIQATES